MSRNTIEQLIKVLDEYKRLGIAEQIDYDKFYLYSLITHSTAIEGSTVTEIENQLLFDEGISAKGRTMQEQLMNLDLKNAYEGSIREAKESVSEVDTKGGQKTKKVDRKSGQKTRDAILDMITKDAKITSTQMATALGINRSAVSKHLKKMQENGIIRREGPDKGGKWIVL